MYPDEPEPENDVVFMDVTRIVTPTNLAPLLFVQPHLTMYSGKELPDWRAVVERRDGLLYLLESQPLRRADLDS